MVLSVVLATEIEGRDQENVVKGSWSILEPETKAVTLRLSEGDLSKAKARARKLGTPYQTLLKDFIHQALS